MGENSKIEWTDHTFNPWVGCTKVSPACDHCYAEGWAKRTGQAALWSGERRRTTPGNWRQPLKWDKEAAASDVRRKVFCSSLADVFDNQVPTKWRDDLWELIRITPHLDWLLLTKRPQNITKMLPRPLGFEWLDWPLPNVWLGATVENQEEADRRIPHLLAVPAAVRFLSCEPLLGPLELDLAGIDWVIAGGESGPGARPMHPDWARSLRDQCVEGRVPFFFKQWGNWYPHLDRDKDDPDWRAPYSQMKLSDGFTFLNLKGGCGFHGDRLHVMERTGKKAAGALLDGREWREFPPARGPAHE